MKQTSIVASVLVAIALGHEARAASFIGAINFSSAPGGGVELRNVSGMVTTDILEATGIQAWLLPQVDVRSGSFVSVPEGEMVTMSQPWVFNPTSPLSPLWAITGPDNFAFHLASATVEFQGAFLLVSGVGTLTGTGFDATPATWFFSTQGVPTNGRYSWSSSTTAVPEPGAPVLLGAALLGACFFRRRNPALFPRNNNDHETNISPRDVADCLDGPDFGGPGRLHFRFH